ncbi:acyl-CoA dehydrogenase [uncultured Pseudacidovorax sp.]|uniref:acyl-CoA dehydrogenase n=1 Tax=uncultured Pseudacidovorax sp. TaxID=679313 RepID=UPI0025FD90F9|nr:acyl-CoA dehydrogenase [uncultured Pseudacidovorax sp.]
MTDSSTPFSATLAQQPAQVLDALAEEAGGALALRHLVAAGIDQLPLPGHGSTLLRWQWLAAVAAVDLNLAKLYEGHTDALAILDELHGPAPAEGSLWGTWCAEPPSARLRFERTGGEALRLHGPKAWCSGATHVTHAVVSGWYDDGQPGLAVVTLHAPGVTISNRHWHAVGMGPSDTGQVDFDATPALALGQPGDYVARAGFWHGGAGIAACWWGGASAIARAMRRRFAAGKPDAHQLAHLGAAESLLCACASLLRECASWIDTHPTANAQATALRARLVVEHAVGEVVQHAGRALGAGPLCADAHFARLMADLPVFVRQSHAERDQAELGRLALAHGTTAPAAFGGWCAL